MEEEQLPPELKQQIAALDRLQHLEEFKTWRELVVLPRLTQLEDALKSSDEMTEGQLRGSVKHYLSIKDLFYDVFVHAADRQREITEEALENQVIDNQEENLDQTR